MGADKHNKNVQAIRVFWRVPKKGWKNNRRRENKRTGEGSIGANHRWWQWFRKQLLSRPLLCQVKAILSPWLRQPPHRRVSKTPSRNLSLSLSLSHHILLFSFNLFTFKIHFKMDSKSKSKNHRMIVSCDLMMHAEAIWARGATSSGDGNWAAWVCSCRIGYARK